jgi:hypothetical protein
MKMMMMMIFLNNPPVTMFPIKDLVLNMPGTSKKNKLKKQTFRVFRCKYIPIKFSRSIEHAARPRIIFKKVNLITQ